MDRTLVWTAQVAIPSGHRVEVTEQTDPLTQAPVLVSLLDLDTGILYRRAEEPLGDLARWLGRVLECTVIVEARVARTILTVDPVGPGAVGSTVALRGADAAADAAKAEADRWGGVDRPPAEEPERFW
ncbi:hypothetical protein KZC51_13835 [Microbacterium sp. SSW1-49]|uniref:Uncharacterized protein n=1 Tax=Microbacterium croceum TaxID=2851645 RepID=A0ABT0FGL9_9MICO|nr:hypothetical protein [Microbacterium croceum]MCK2037210.1 hypothetical protein [Microbacterium croceum]